MRLLLDSPRLVASRFLIRRRQPNQPLETFRRGYPNESHAFYKRHTAWPLSRFLPRFTRSSSGTPVLTSFKPFNASSKVHLRSSVSFIPDAINAVPCNRDVHHNVIYRSSSWAVWSPPLQDGSEGYPFISRRVSSLRIFLTQHRRGF